MSAIPLKRILRKKDAVVVLEAMNTLVKSPFQIIDADGTVIFGDNVAGDSKFPVTVWEEEIGSVVGGPEAAALAGILFYIAKTEQEKKALGAEALDKYKELTFLYDIGERLASCLDVNEVATLIMTEAMKLVVSDSVCVLLKDKESGNLQAITATGVGFPLDTTIKPDRGILLSGRGEIVNDVKSDNRLAADFTSNSSLMCAPMRIKDEITSLILIGTKEPHTYTAEDLKLLSALASQSAVAIENARLYDDLRKTFISTVYGLAKAIGQRDPFTGKHTKRVMELSTAIGKEMGLPDSQVQAIQLAAILHDVGKIAIPDEILCKKGALSEHERALFQKHPVIGEELVKDIKQLEHVITGVRHHHERINGSGYPDGLTGDNISIIARIIAVADVYDAISSDRAYRKGLKHILAIEELKKNSGKCFDENVVKAFFRVIRKKPDMFKET